MREKDSAIPVPNEATLVNLANSGGPITDFINYVKPENKLSNAVTYGFGGMAVFLGATLNLTLYGNPTLNVGPKLGQKIEYGAVFSFGVGFIYGYTHFKEEPNGK